LDHSPSLTEGKCPNERGEFGKKKKKKDNAPVFPVMRRADEPRGHLRHRDVQLRAILDLGALALDNLEEVRDGLPRKPQRLDPVQTQKQYHEAMYEQVANDAVCAFVDISDRTNRSTTPSPPASLPLPAPLPLLPVTGAAMVALEIGFALGFSWSSDLNSSALCRCADIPICSNLMISATRKHYATDGNRNRVF
jgi:hypothetical protein